MVGQALPTYAIGKAWKIGLASPAITFKSLASNFRKTSLLVQFQAKFEDYPPYKPMI